MIHHAFNEIEDSEAHQNASGKEPPPRSTITRVKECKITWNAIARTSENGCRRYRTLTARKLNGDSKRRLPTTCKILYRLRRIKRRLLCSLARRFQLAGNSSPHGRRSR
jgi:hypothetical protein